MGVATLLMGVTRLTQLVQEALRLQAVEIASGFAESNAALVELTAETDFESVLQHASHLRTGTSDERQLYARLVAEITMSQEERAKRVLQIVSEETDPYVLRWLVFGLRNAGSVSAIDALRQLARHPSPVVRFPVPDALSACADSFDTVADLLIALSHDDDADVRWSAVYELGAWWRDTRDPRIESRLLAASDDPSPEVRSTARDAIANC